jgi:DNA polymerase-3 subunit alpha
MTRFVHLRLHTEYSLVDSVVRVDELMNAVAAAGMPAVALTDQSNLFAMVKFYKAAVARGIKPIVGVDAWLAEPGERAEPSRLVLLCQTLEGYRNLTRLVSRSYLEGQRRGLPQFERSWLTPDSVRGLIALSGGRDGDIGRALTARREAEAEAMLAAWLELFSDRFYLELVRTGRTGEEDYVQAALRLAVRRRAPVVATNDVRFLRQQDFESHEARVCIHGGALLTDPSRLRRYSDQQYLRSPAEMAGIFADVPEALENAVQIAQRCSLDITLGTARLPEYPVPDGGDEDVHLRQQAAEGLKTRIVQLGATVAGPPSMYAERLATELDCICQMGFAGYFLIVADFIRWARAHDIPVGPGRGSGAGSLVAYALRITDLDPLAYDLLFERFLNPERVSMPDFDIDFCMDGRDRVIDYVADKYGRDRVSQIITYGSLAAKAVVRDVGRVLGHNYGYVDRIAKLIPFELGITLETALEKEEELQRLYKTDEEVRTLIDLARSLEGLVRNAGTHAGGVVIAPSVLTDFAPLYAEEGSSNVVTQFDKDDVEAAGLVKFDFLGLRTLTIIDWTVKTINAERAERGEAALDLAKIPMNDAQAFALLKSCRTTAVFQLESRGMKDLIRRLQPDRFEDVVALVALFRPGPLQSGMVDDFMERKHGRAGARVDYLHPSLESIMKPTYGVILYQEQVMQIAQVLAGYTLGGADLLRRAMGKKKAEEMAQQRSVFVSGAVARGVEERQAAHIFDLMEKFAGYGFNKSHSAAYALLSYQTAWLKAHYPSAFMAAVLSSDMDKTDKVVTLIDECATLGLEVEPPDVNHSQYRFTVAGERKIRYGLGAVKGVGQAAVEALAAERERAGPFTSVEDLCRRLDLQRVNRRALEALIRSGCCDGLGANRATLMARLPAAMRLGEQNTRAHETGQVDLFGLAAGAAARSERMAPLEIEDWPPAVRLAGERETLGLYLTGHPISEYESELASLTHGRLAELAAERAPNGADRGWQNGGNANMVTVAGLVLEVRRRANRVSLILDDRTGRMEVTLFDDVLQAHRELIVKDAILLIDGNLRYDEFIEGWRIAARKLQDMAQVRELQARRLHIRVPPTAGGGEFILRLEELMKPVRKPGGCNVLLHYATSQAQAKLAFGVDWTLKPTGDFLERLTKLVGRESWRLSYGPRAGTNEAVVTESG